MSTLDNSIRCAGSFRDPSGTVYLGENCVYRTINQCYAEQWEQVKKTGFFESALAKKLIIPFEETDNAAAEQYKILQSPLLPFVSYPYEWSFGQYKDAALHTLDVLDEALAFGLVLKDATAYNIQFFNGKPIFIDLLSFEIRDIHKPWEAYLQFCKHFLAPLALMAKRSVSCGRMMETWIEGLPLDLVSSILPWRTKFSVSLGIHLHMHAKMQAKYGDARKAKSKVQSVSLKDDALLKLSQSLRYAINSLEMPHDLQTEWGDYYNDTNYTERGAQDKREYLEKIASENAEKELAVDLGANQGVYSRFLSEYYNNVLAVDIDYLAVEKFYRALKKEAYSNILPLVFDLGNPSPNIGWANKERMTFAERCKASYVSALALVHHLVFTAGIPLFSIAEYFSTIVKKNGILAFEFVPLEDSQVQRLLAVRENPFPDYDLSTCKNAFSEYFEVVEEHQVTDSKRTIVIFRKIGEE